MVNSQPFKYGPMILTLMLVCGALPGLGNHSNAEIVSPDRAPSKFIVYQNLASNLSEKMPRLGLEYVLAYQGTAGGINFGDIVDKFKGAVNKNIGISIAVCVILFIISQFLIYTGKSLWYVYGNISLIVLLGVGVEWSEYADSLFYYIMMVVFLTGTTMTRHFVNEKASGLINTEVDSSYDVEYYQKYNSSDIFAKAFWFPAVVSLLNFLFFVLFIVKAFVTILQA